MARLFLLLSLALTSIAKVSREPLHSWYKGLYPENVLFAVNCGADEPHTDMNGVQWQPDTGALGGVKSGEGGNQRWVVPNSEVYMTERWGNSENFTYEIPFDPMIDSDYTLVLKFSEQYFTEAGKKVFDVSIGDKVVLSRLDPFARAGSKLLPYDAFIEFKSKRGDLLINGEKVKSAIKKEKLQVHFILGDADNPKVNAIALVKGGTANTHKANFEKYQQTLLDIQEEKAAEKAKEELLFNDDLYDFEERIDGQGIFN